MLVADGTTVVAVGVAAVAQSLSLCAGKNAVAYWDFPRLPGSIPFRPPGYAL
jgi:hypothetical protein